ncbi:MAG: O-antigen ligase family protein [Verrucomicrobiota bacterium]
MARPVKTVDSAEQVYDPVEAFRRASNPGAAGRSTIAPREWIIIYAAAPALIVSPFLLGGMVWWAQVAIAIMQAIPFLLVLLPIPGPIAWKERMVRLLRFPPFWLGGTFVLYVIIQALNPSWEQVYIDSTSYYVGERKPEYFISWLPTSMNTNFYVMNPWRMVVFWAGAWAFVCALWAGLRSRRAWLAIAWIALGTGAVLSMASIVHHLSSNEYLFWITEYKRNINAFGPFVYRNQGAAYLYLSMGIGFALFFHLLNRNGLRSGLPLVALMLAFVCGLGVAINASRGGWIGGACVVLAFIVFLPFAIRWRDGFSWGSLVGFAAVLICMGGIGFWYSSTMDFSEIDEKWTKIMEERDDEASIGARIVLTEITWQMFKDKPLTGWGGGSFHYQFPYYAAAYPEIYFVGRSWWSQYGKVLRKYRQAHNDIVQFLSDYGIIGCSFLFLCGLYWFVRPILSLSFSVEGLMALSVAFAFLVHNFADFFLQNSITLQSWLILLLLSAGLKVSNRPQRRSRSA